MAILDFERTPKEAKEDASRCLATQLVPFLRGSPGVGKSGIADDIAKENGLFKIDMRASMMTPEDFMGLPMRGVDENGQLLRSAEFVPFTFFPVQGVPVPKGYNGWLLLADEMNSANRAVQAAMYKLTLDRFAGMQKLHDLCFVMAAGNKRTDNAIVNDLGTAMQSRLVHINLKVDAEEWINWAMKTNIDPRVIAYIRWKNEDLHVFDPNHQDVTFACPRTWEFASRLVTGVDDLEPLKPLLAGTIGSGMAVNFVTFSQIFKDLPTIDEIVAAPTKVPVPTELSIRFATISHLITKIEMQNAKQVVAYVSRFPEEDEIIFYKSTIQRHPTMKGNPDIQRQIMRLMAFLNDD